MKTIQDEYITWLRFACAGFLEQGNVWCFDHAIKNMPEHLPMVEIGSFCGLSTNVITHCCSKHGRDNPLFCIDKWIFEGAEQGGPLGESQLDHSQYREFVMESFKRNVTFFSQGRLPRPIEAFSDDFFLMWRRGADVVDIFGHPQKLGGAIGFAYVDGSHQPAQCRRDFENIDAFLAPEGFILFDDSSEKAPFGLHPFMLELSARKDYELVVQNPNFLFRKLG